MDSKNKHLKRMCARLTGNTLLDFESLVSRLSPMGTASKIFCLDFVNAFRQTEKSEAMRFVIGW